MWGWGKWKGVIITQLWPRCYLQRLRRAFEILHDVQNTLSEKTRENSPIGKKNPGGGKSKRDHFCMDGWVSNSQESKTVPSSGPHTASLHSCSPDLSHKQAKARAGPSPAEYKELWSRFKSVLVLFRSKLLCYLTVRPFADTQTPADRNRNRNRNSEDASGIFVLFCGEKTKRKQYFTVMDYFYEKLTNCKTNEWNAKLTC